MLADYEGCLPDSAARAVQRRMRMGIGLYICTGCSRTEIYPYFRNVGLDGMISGNGNYVEDSGR